MKNKRINLLLILCFSLIFFITSFDCAYAAEENGSLNIILTYERQAIDGAEFSVYQVAKWNEKESRHTVKAPFRWNGDFVNIKTADDQLKLSLYFEKQSRNIKEMMKGETGDDGTAKFTDLKDGIYLVVQTGSSGKAKDFTNVQPFLVIIPQFENGIQNRVVNAKPKTEIQRKEKPEIPPQTPPDLSPKKTSSNRRYYKYVSVEWSLDVKQRYAAAVFQDQAKKQNRGGER